MFVAGQVQTPLPTLAFPSPFRFFFLATCYAVWLWFRGDVSPVPVFSLSQYMASLSLSRLRCERRCQCASTCMGVHPYVCGRGRTCRSGSIEWSVKETKRKEYVVLEREELLLNRVGT